MYAKLVNGSLQKPGKFVLLNERVYVNPSDEILSEMGYKTVIETAPPEEREGYYLVRGYEEKEDGIYVIWTYTEIEESIDDIDAEVE